MWFERDKKFLEGVNLISKSISNEVFESVLTGLYKAKGNQEQIQSILVNGIAGIDNPDQRKLIMKTFVYLVQRLNLFILSPVKLQNDLTQLGFSAEQTEIIVRTYSESNRALISNIGFSDFQESHSVNCTMKTTLVDDAHVRCKKATAQLSLNSNDGVVILDDFDITSMSTLFKTFEEIQFELDKLSSKS